MRTAAATRSASIEFSHHALPHRNPCHRWSRCLRSRAAGSLLNFGRALRHQRQMGLRHREPQPLRRSCPYPGRRHRNCRLPRHGRARPFSPSQASCRPGVRRSRVFALPHLYRKVCSRGLLHLLRHLAGHRPRHDTPDRRVGHQAARAAWRRLTVPREL